MSCPITRRLRVSLRLVALVATAALAACASTKPPFTAGQGSAVVEVPASNEHLRAEGIPPVPKALADRVAKYMEFEAVNVIAWLPDRRAMLVAYRRRATTQLHLLDQPMGTPEPLTEFPDPVGSGSFEPKRGSYLVYQRDTGGDEATQFYRYDFAREPNADFQFVAQILFMQQFLHR